MTEIRNLADLAAMFGVEPGESQKITQDCITEAVKKYTKDVVPGEVWIAFSSLGIQLGGSMEGCEYGSRIYGLTYPFNQEDFYLCIGAIAVQAIRVQAWLNGEQELANFPAGIAERLKLRL